MNALDEESDLLRKKSEEEKARKRTRGPYRKSQVNYYPTQFVFDSIDTCFKSRLHTSILT